jgi:hypothetical protein
MSSRLKITVSIEGEDGGTILTSTSERAVPYIEEIDKQGFRSAFHELETAILESRKEACDSALSDYLEIMSQKKQDLRQYPVVL